MSRKNEKLVKDLLLVCQVAVAGLTIWHLWQQNSAQIIVVRPR